MKQYLKVYHETQTRESRQHSKKVSLLASLVVVAFVGTVAVFSSTSGSPTSSGRSSVSARTTATFQSTDFTPVTIQSSNSYGGSSSLGKEYPWITGKTVAEPYRSTTLLAKGDAIDEAETIVWTVGSETQEGEEAYFRFTETGDYSVNLAVTHATTGEVSSVDFPIICVYGERRLPSTLALVRSPRSEYSLFLPPLASETGAAETRRRGSHGLPASRVSNVDPFYGRRQGQIRGGLHRHGPRRPGAH